MSLYALADQMAAKGRNGDSVLVHMTPGEVQGLQALAMANGGSLTINPETGLPEANFLKKMLPAIAGAALNFFAPGVGTAIGSALGASAAVGTGVAVGGLTALATGSLSRGLAAGLGAYGGAGLTSALADTGASALGTEAFGAAAKEGVAPEVVQKAVEDRIASASMADKLGAGFKAATASPSAAFDFLKPNLQTAYAAAVPAMLADKGVTTKTQMPGDTGYIRQFTFDPYTQRYTPVGVYPASEYGKEPPPGMAGGGVVALAAGGPAPGTPEYTKMVSDWFQQYPNATAADVQSAIKTYGLNPDDVVNAMRSSGMSGASIYSAFHPDVGVPETPLGGLAGLTSNITNFVDTARARTDLTPAQIREEAYRAMVNEGYTMDDVRRATGMTVDQLFPDLPKKITQPVDYGPVNVPQDTSTNLPVTPTGPNETYTREDVNKGWWGGTGEPVVGVKEFDPMGRIQRPIPRDLAQHEEWYNRLTGGSEQAYDYLMGRGAYPIKPVTASGALFRPYGEVVLGQPASSFNTPFIFDPVTRSYKPNPNYKKPESLKTTGAAGTAGTAGTAGVAGAVDPRTLFDEAAYLEANPDVAAEIKSGKANFGDAYGHFLRYGLDEGRPGGVADIVAFRKALEEWQRSQQAGSGASPGDAFGGTSSGETGVSAEGEANAGGPGSAGGPDNARGGLIKRMALGGLGALAAGGTASHLGDYSDGGRLLKGPGDGVSDSIPATIGGSRPARLADGEFVVPARIVSEIGNGSTDAGARKLYAMMDRVQRARGKTVGKGKVAKDTNADKYLPA